MGRSFHFHYEDSTDDVRLLSLSYLSRIPKDRMAQLIQLRDSSAFSRAGNYQEYEAHRFRAQLAQGQQPEGEFERFQRAVEILNYCWRPVDMTGADKNNPGRGYGLVDEIATIIARDLSPSDNVFCAGVLADYAGAAVRAHFNQFNREEAEKKVVLQDWPLNMRRKVAARFNCPVWSIQQLNTTTNACAPGHLPKQTDSADCKSFAENCHFCFVIGLPTSTGQVPFVARKHRREGEHAPIVLTLRGGQARIIDTRDDWVYYESTRRIMSRELADSYYGAIIHAQQHGGQANEDDENLDERIPADDDVDPNCNIVTPPQSRRPHRTDWWTGERFAFRNRGGVR
jgi:hypothetical protein